MAHSHAYGLWIYCSGRPQWRKNTLLRVIPTLTNYSGIVSDKSSWSIYGIEYTYIYIFWHSIWHCFWHILWHSIRHSFWHSIWHLFWHTFWHIFWHSFWHSIQHIFLTFYLAPILKFILTFWHSIWYQFWHTFWHIFWYSFWHKSFLALCLAFSLACFRAQACPQYPELTICNSGPGVAHSVRSWEEDRSDRQGRQRWRRRSEGVAPLLESRDNHLAGGGKMVSVTMSFNIDGS